MRELLSPIVDRLQATFPPNRVAILLAGPIVGLAGIIAAWLAAHAPGIHLGQIEIAGALFAGLAIAVRLLDRWFDQWQAGEPINAQADLEAAFDEIVEGHQTIDHLLGTTAGIGVALEDLHDQLEKGQINEAEVVDQLKAIAGTTDAVLRRHLLADQAEPEPPQDEVPSPAPAAPPTAGE